MTNESLSGKYLFSPRETIKVTLGVFKNIQNCLSALKGAATRLDDTDRRILGRIEFFQGEVEFDLAILSLNDLDLSLTAGYDEICEMAAKFGLRPCPAEVAPTLMVYLMNSRLPSPIEYVVAMNPIDTKVRLHTFTLCSELRVLNTIDKRRVLRWRERSRFVFLAKT